MRSVADISRVFARYVASEQAAPVAPPTLGRGIFSLDHLGLVGLFGARFVPSLEAAERLRSKRELGFPARCVACGRPVAEQVRLHRARLLQPALVLLERVPHCRQHAAVGPVFWFDAAPLGADQLWEIAEPDASVAADVVALGTTGDRLPPWRAFPALNPESSGWRQGEGEAWLRLAWHPFWGCLAAGQRSVYLERWRAPAGWAQAVFELSAFTPLEG